MKPWAAPQPKTQEVLSRLNSIRASSADIIETRLPQIKFSARGLRSSHPAAAVAVEGMIASLDGNLDAINTAAEEYFDKYPTDAQGALNFLRSYAVLHDREGVRRFANKAIELLGAEHAVAHVAPHLFSAGLFDELQDYLSGLNFDELRGDDLAVAAQNTVVLEGLKKNDAWASDFMEYLAAARASIAAMGWPYPVDQLHVGHLGMDEDCPVATIIMEVDATPEELLSLEESILDAVSVANGVIQEKGLFTMQMGFA